MKKIIKGKIYNTETATLLGEASNGLPTSDFRYWDEALYQTPRSKVFFLAGEGGAMTQWAQPCDGGHCGGEGIKPLSKEDALAWAERYLPTEVVEAFFGDMIEEA